MKTAGRGMQLIRDEEASMNDTNIPRRQVSPSSKYYHRFDGAIAGLTVR